MSIRESSAPAERVEFIDSLRGFALLGVFWANLPIFAGIAYLTDDQRAATFSSPVDSFAYWFEQFFIENKFMGLFSILFGVSFWLFLSRVRSRDGSPVGLFYRRVGWLLVIGLMHGWLLWSFDILRFYALWALLLPLFVRTPPRRLLAIALTACILVPAVVSGARVWLAAPSGTGSDLDGMALTAFSTGSYRQVLTANWNYDWYLTLSIGQIAYQVAVFGRLLLGLYFARTIDLGRLELYRPQLRRVLLGGVLAGLLGSAVFAWHLLADGGILMPFIRRFLVESGQLGLTLTYASGLGLLAPASGWRSPIRLLAPVGRMALTWYLLQTLFGIWMFYGFARGPALMGRVGPAGLAAVSLVGFIAQVWLARAWLNQFRFGPAEWLWRSLTYWRLQPLKVALPIRSA